MKALAVKALCIYEATGAKGLTYHKYRGLGEDFFLFWKRTIPENCCGSIMLQAPWKTRQNCEAQHGFFQAPQKMF